MSSMVEKKKVATVMDELTKVGATDILVLEIANTRVDARSFRHDALISSSMTTMS